MSTSRDRFVLAVDDDPAYLSILKLSLRACGFNKIYTAPDGVFALNHLEVTKFNLIVSDWNMAPLNGLELLRAVKKDPRTAEIPFVLTSENLSEKVWREAIDLGVTEFLAKPFSLPDLRYACFAACGAAEFANSMFPKRSASPAWL